jgi:hypothetical protein
METAHAAIIVPFLLILRALVATILLHGTSERKASFDADHEIHLTRMKFKSDVAAVTAEGQAGSDRYKSLRNP